MNRAKENLESLEASKYYNPKKWINSFVFGLHRIILKDSAIAIIFGLFLIPAIYGCSNGATAREKLANSFMLFLIAGIIHLIEGFRFKSIVRSNIISQMKKNDFFPEQKEFDEISEDIELKLKEYIKSNKFYKTIYEKFSKSTLKLFFINLSLLSILMTFSISVIFGKLDLNKKEALRNELKTKYLSEVNTLKNELNQKKKDSEKILDSIFKIQQNELRNIKSDLRQNEFILLKQVLAAEYTNARQAITKKDWLRTQFDPKHNYLIYIAKLLESISLNKNEVPNSEYLTKALLLTPAGNIEETVSLCKRNIDRVYPDVSYEDSFLLRRVADKAVGVSVGDENNEKYTKFIWQDNLVGKNAFGMQIRNGIYCEVVFEKSLNSKNQLNYIEKLNKLVVGRNRIY